VREPSRPHGGRSPGDATVLRSAAPQCVRSSEPFDGSEVLARGFRSPPHAPKHRAGKAPAGACVDAWDEAAAEEFVGDCRRRTLAIAARRPGDLRLKPLADDARTCTPARANLAGWLAARAARVLDGEEGRAAERGRQAAWLRPARPVTLSPSA